MYYSVASADALQTRRGGLHLHWELPLSYLPRAQPLLCLLQLRNIRLAMLRQRVQLRNLMA